MMNRAERIESGPFRLFLAALGAVCVGVALAHIVMGIEAIPGAFPASATNDSEDRFYATLFLFFGIALIHGAQRPTERIAVLRASMLVFFLGGTARVVSFAAMGVPHPLFVILGFLELAIPALFWRIDRAPPSAWLLPFRAAAPRISPSATVARLVFALGACCCLIAIAYMTIGWPAVPGGSHLNATMDSELRFYASLFLGFGLALIWTSFDLAKRRLVLRFLLVGFATAGGARVISWIAVGAPNTLFISQAILEVTLPALLWIWFRSHERALEKGD